MRTVKEVAELTGVSVRTLQYYDEIGIFKPTKVNDAGYRFYDDTALEKLQQILFFKELDFQLKDIKEITETAGYNKLEIFKKQKKLLTVKRNRLNRLLELLERLEKGEVIMSFKEFDMSEYIDALEQFKLQNVKEVVKYWGSIDIFNDFIQKVKDDESNVAKLAIKEYGSIEKYTEAMKYNLDHFTEIMESQEALNKEFIDKRDALYARLTSDRKKDATSEEIQKIVSEIITYTQEKMLKPNAGKDCWNIVIESYSKDLTKRMNDAKYGEGSSEYIAKAFRYYFDKKENKNNDQGGNVEA